VTREQKKSMTFGMFFQTCWVSMLYKLFMW